MPQSELHIRLDSDIKSDFKRICRRSGITASQAMGVYAKEACREGRLPVKARHDTAEGHLSADRLCETMLKLRSSTHKQFRLDLRGNTDLKQS